MGVYVNDLGSVNSFENLIAKKFYVDKSRIIKVLEELLEETNTEHFCISRPRRFGKTTILQLLNAYYCKYSFCGKEKFNYINNDFHKFNVITLNMVGESNKDYVDFINGLSMKVVKDLKLEFPEYDKYIDSDCRIDEAVNIVTSKSRFKEKFILLIDEWDYYIRNCELSEKEEKKVLEFYNSLTKGKANFYFSIFFGIYPKSGFSRDSLANNIEDYSVLCDDIFNECIGLTVSEVENLCKYSKFNIDINDLLNWYNGYIIGGESIMSANSITKVISKGDIKSYWTSTSSSLSLIEFFISNSKDLWNKLLKREGIEFKSNDSSHFLNSKTLNLKDKTKVIYELIHSGYLIVDTDGLLKIPNSEALQEFLLCSNLISGGNELFDILKDSSSIINCILTNDSELLSAIIRKMHAKYVSSPFYNDEGALNVFCNFIFISAINGFNIHRELNSGEGYCDIAILSKDNSTAIVLELKKDDSANNALKQIKDKKYWLDFESYSRIVLVGVSYSAKTKDHEAVIEEFKSDKCEFNSTSYF